MTHLRQAYRAEASADENVAIALGHRDEKRRVLGVALRAERERQSIGLRELAKRIGCSPAMLSEIERGTRWSVATVHAACEVLGCVPLDGAA